MKEHLNETPMAGGAVTSSKIPRLELNPTEAIVRLAARFEEGIRRKPPGKAWNALSANQEVLVDKEFILARIGHVEYHCLKLRDKIKGDWPLTDDDDAGAVIWGGAFLCCATKALEDSKTAENRDLAKERRVLEGE